MACQSFAVRLRFHLLRACRDDLSLCMSTNSLLSLPLSLATASFINGSTTSQTSSVSIDDDFSDEEALKQVLAELTALKRSVHPSTYTPSSIALVREREREREREKEYLCVGNAVRFMFDR